MKWVIEQMARGYVNNITRGKNQHTKETRLLKYCVKCNLVFQKDSMYSIQLYYRNMPTYKLPRETCKKCKGKT